MRLEASDPDIQTLIARIENGDINLQPEFQRGEVWGSQKQRRLIDSVLRNWHVPPIHIVIVPATGQQEVLDGQQRLVAIRNFVRGEITVDGTTEPYNEEIASLDGVTYSNLPTKFKRLFDNFTIRLFKLQDYEPEEPGELFYRLNQPTNLTAAEQRNAFFGPARNQVKNLVKHFSIYKLGQKSLGFSNSRMAYDDVIAKVCMTLSYGTFKEKITALSVTEKYRSSDAFSDKVITRATESIEVFGRSLTYVDPGIKFNKATVYSWLCFIAVAVEADIRSDLIGSYINDFETLRGSIREGESKAEAYDNFLITDRTYVEWLILVFNDRASARVADVSSVVARDFILWFLFYLYGRNKYQTRLLHGFATRYKCCKYFENALKSGQFSSIEKLIADSTAKFHWGDEL